MDRLRERLTLANNALQTLAEVQAADAQTTIKRDAAILRFTYTFEAVWKAAQRYLADIEGVEASSPKSCIRECRDAGLLNDDQATSALAMANDRNLCVHLYDENLAEELWERLPAHTVLLTAWLGAMMSRLPQAAS